MRTEVSLGLLVVIAGCGKPAASETVAPSASAPAHVETEPPGDKVVLVELYTSQGCDSCPTADAFIGELPSRGWSADKVIPLTFHVTYWDDLGWQDPYGSMIHDQRQIAYAQVVSGAKADGETTIRGPYTPQMVVDGRVHFSGTLTDVAQREITTASRSAAPIELAATATLAGSAQVVVDVESRAVVSAGLNTDEQKVGLFVAVTQKTVTTEVPRGENAGKQLDEFWVVREFQGPKLFRSSRKNTTQFKLALPADVSPDALDVVVFAQDLASLAVYATVAVPIGE